MPLAPRIVRKLKNIYFYCISLRNVCILLCKRNRDWVMHIFCAEYLERHLGFKTSSITLMWVTYWIKVQTCGRHTWHEDLKQPLATRDKYACVFTERIGSVSAFIRSGPSTILNAFIRSPQSLLWSKETNPMLSIHITKVHHPSDPPDPSYPKCSHML